ncbi:MAG: CoA transferase [Dehalococcoidales bacterium]|nr:CoA transferase [Dehalococcoidales bacterium]
MTWKSALHHIRILDFTRVLAGPYATRILADFGAEIIKVQSPSVPAAEDDFARGYYETWNRNKLSITLNLDNSEGLALAKRLVAVSDVVCENFTPRVMVNWELDYSNLKKIKPDIIMLSMSLMGQTEPWRDYTGYGPTVQAFAGITGLTAHPGHSPSGLGFSYADHVAGLFGALAILSALEHHQRTGEGQYIDLSETETMSSLLGDAILNDTMNNKETTPKGNRSPEAAPHNVYRCHSDDRWIAIAVFNDNEWQSFKEALGNPPWAGEDRFSTMAKRWQNSDELDELITKWTMMHTAEDIMVLLQERGVAAGVVQNASDLAHDPQMKERGFFTNIDDSEKADISDASPMKLSRTPAQYSRAAPQPSRDNSYVYGQLLGMSESEIARLHEAGVI